MALGSQKDAAYYDKVFKDCEIYKRHWRQQNEWSLLWERAAILLLIEGAKHVIDIGCGMGHFKPSCNLRGISYRGYDFSLVAIDHAIKTYGAHFKLRDIIKNPVTIAEDAYAFIEFLEHIENDLTFLQQYPVGQLVVITVPRFDNIAHVRHFETVASVFNYYASVIHINGNIEPVGDTHYIFTGRVHNEYLGNQ
jgi:SAM-dependent methyltransferase